MNAMIGTAFRLHRRSIMLTLMRIVRDQETAEDLTQETFMRARSPVSLGKVHHVEAFLHRTARNLAFDHQRRLRMQARFEQRVLCADEWESVPDDLPSPEASMIERQQLDRLERALARLPERARDAWRLCRGEGLTHAEAAVRLNVSPGTVYNDLKLVLAHCGDTMRRAERARGHR